MMETSIRSAWWASSAFNSPSRWAWNASLALACGDTLVWKPSEKTPLTALACQAILERAAARFGDAPKGLSQVTLGGRETGDALVGDPRVALISATGSTRMGRAVAARAAQRLARTLLELGGNNAMVVAPSADLDLAVRAITFAAAGTAGQRCTTLRRLFVHDSVYPKLIPSLKKIYASLPVGDPLKEGTLVGPLIDGAAFDAMQAALELARRRRRRGARRARHAGRRRWRLLRAPALVGARANRGHATGDLL
jgi:aldehyde dehydrogenase (NAD+)